MKRDEAALARLWLLVQSGEADAAQRQELAQWVASDPEAARQVAGWAWVCEQSAARQAACTGPDAVVLARVMEVARAARPVEGRRGRLIRFPLERVTRLAAQAAAVLLLFGGGWWTVRQVWPSGGESLHPSASVELLLLVASGAVEEWPAAVDGGRGEMDRLADQLLEFQGFDAGNPVEDEWIRLLQDEPSTTPQARSMHGFPAERCG